MKAGVGLKQTEKWPLVVAFVVPFGVRIVPELFAGPYPLGFDTITYYLPIITSRIAFLANATDYLGGTTVLYLLLTVLYLHVGYAPLLMKIVPAILLGFFGLAAFAAGRQLMGWTPHWSLSLAFVTSLNFVSLRISWDLDRNLLGLGLVLLTLAFLFDSKSSRRFLVVPVTSTLSVMVHESSGVLVIVVGLSYLVLERKFRMLREWLQFVPALLLLGFQFVSGRGLGAQVQSALPSPDLLTALEFNFGFLLFAFAALIPLSLLGIVQGLKRPLATWGIVAALFAVLPNFGWNTGDAYRWALLLTVPLSVLFVQGVRKCFSVRQAGRRALGRVAVAVSLLAIVFFSSGYVGLHHGVEGYFGLAPEYGQFMPASMVESSVAIVDVPSIRAISSWANSSLSQDSLLLLPFQLYGWYVVTLGRFDPDLLSPLDQTMNLDEIISSIRPTTGPDVVFAYKVNLFVPDATIALAQMADRFTATARTKTYVVWWYTAQVGNYRGTLPAGFIPVFYSGQFAVYFDGGSV